MAYLQIFFCDSCFFIYTQIGEKSLFTKELENALERNE